MKLIITDLDGTLIDTKDVNYYAYKEALASFGYDIDYKYYCEFCNGRNYMEFLPQISTNDKEELLKIHNKKKEVYEKYLDKAVLNKKLVNIIRLMKSEYKTAIVTTASKINCMMALNKFELVELFDLILTKDDVITSKPDPEGFIKAMQYFDAKPDDTIIFEDSEVGIKAAESTHTSLFVVKGYN